MAFPLDPNSPRLAPDQERRRERQWKQIERAVLLLSLVLSILGIILAVKSLRVSEVSYQASVEQYVESNLASTAQFDTIARILMDQRKINSNILGITGSQLNGSRDLLAQVAALNEPDLIVRKASYTSAGDNMRANFKTFISVQIDNTGRRSLKLLQAESFVVTGDKVNAAHQMDNLDHVLNSDYLLTFRFIPPTGDNLIFVFKFRYQDLYTGKVTSKQLYYIDNYQVEDYDDFSSQSERDRSKPIVLAENCTAEEIIRARTAVRLFEQEHAKIIYYSAK